MLPAEGPGCQHGHHDKHHCAQNADHLAHNTPFSAFLAEVVCTLGTTAPQTVISPPPNGGDGVIRTTTRRRHADSQPLMLQNPHRNQHGGHQRDRRARAAAPERSEGRAAGRRAVGGGVAWPDNELTRRSKRAARTAEAGGPPPTGTHSGRGLRRPQHPWGHSNT